MTVEQSIGLVLALVVMSFGVIGSVVPGIPSTPLVLLAAIGHRLYFGPASISNLFLVLLVLLTLFSMGLDYLATGFGARKLGATWRGLLGAVLGGVIGMFFGPFGILLGPFIGALALELIGGRDFSDAARAGAGAILGLILGGIGKVACCLAMIGIFAVNVIARSGTTLT